MKLLVWTCRLVTGFLFIFSGLIKINDPLGFSYKLQEYSVVFHIRWLDPYTVGLSVLVCALEILLGIAILLGLQPKFTTRALLGLILFFTFLTFYSAWFHKVTECGCFGDAIKMTQWQSFSKNIFLLAMILVLCFQWKMISPVFGKLLSWSLITVLGFAFIYLGFFTVGHLPFIDFLPYKVGNHLPDLMKVPAGAPADEYQIIYTMKNLKSGELRKLDDKEYLSSGIYENKDWKYVSATEPVLIREGYQAPLKDFRITDAQGIDHTSEIVNDPGYELLFVEYDLHHTNTEIQRQLNDLATNAEEFNVRSIGLTAESTEEVDEFCRKVNTMYEIFYCDEVPLKMMVRANPGVVLLHNGTVMGKWHYDALPTYKEMKQTYFQQN